ncbi:MAG TPA: hypothetical protein VFD58_32600 [Blastocatellia bacterium]|nr:hypothetical protein [Blastocatellia bacterium]
MNSARPIQCSLCRAALLAALILTQHQPAQATPPKHRLVVSFVSFASGIDHKAKDEIDRYIARYEKKQRIRLAKEKVYWGMEGEIDYCFRLSELAPARQKTFIAGVRSLAAKSKQVSVNENVPCHNKRQQ